MFVDGAKQVRRVDVSAGKQRRLVVVPDPTFVPVLVVGGATALVVAAIPWLTSAVAATVITINVGQLVNDDNAYKQGSATPDYNTANTRHEAIARQQRIQLSSLVLQPAVVVGTVLVVVGGAALSAGLLWPELFGWASEEVAP